RWRPPAADDCAAQPQTGTRRAALLGTCARAAPLGAIRPRRYEWCTTVLPSSASTLLRMHFSVARRMREGAPGVCRLGWTHELGTRVEGSGRGKEKSRNTKS